MGRRARARASRAGWRSISQSGNVAVNALASRRGLRFHTVIASGNQAVLSAADYLHVLAADDELRSIALYLEDDGGPRLCEGLAACVDAGVPVSVLKVGRSPAGARAAAAHSARSPATSGCSKASCEEAGAAWAEDVHELLELAKACAVRRPRPGARRWRPGDHDLLGRGLGPGRRRGGAPRARAARARRGDRERLAALLPSAATVANPLDYTSMIWGDAPALARARRGRSGRTRRSARCSFSMTSRRG